MSDPVMFISHFRVKEGKVAALERLNREVADRLRADKPRTLVFLSYLNEERTHVSFLHVFADADSMDIHFEGATERARAAYELIVPEGWEVYGQPSDSALGALRQQAESAGVALTVEPSFVAGFLR